MKNWIMCLAGLCFAATAGAQIRHMAPPMRPPMQPVAPPMQSIGPPMQPIVPQVHPIPAPVHGAAVNPPVGPMITPGTHVVQSFAHTPQVVPIRPWPGSRPSRHPAFNPGILPTYSYPYFPAIGPSVPYYYPDYYSATQPAPEPVAVPDDAPVNDLSQQIRDLNNEVRELRNEILQVKAGPPPAPEVKAESIQPPPPPTPVVLVFKTGRSIETQGYAIVGAKLWVMNGANATEYDLADLDIATTIAENRRRGTSFRAP